MLRSAIMTLVVLCASVDGRAPAEESAAAAEIRSCGADCHCTCAARGAWFVAETENFSVWGQRTQQFSIDLATRCETLRSSLREAWELDGSGKSWQPKCAVVVHADLDDYRRETGNADGSVGSTTVSTDDGRIVFRRIDLRADAAHWQENALPHELTHVVLADRFSGQRLPLWLNEGLAILAENGQLHAKRAAVLTDAQARGQLPSLTAVVGDDGKLVRRDANLSYSVSASLVAHLLANGGRQTLLGFVDALMTDGYERALRATYPHLGNLKNWERHWLESLAATEPVPLPLR